MKLLRVSLFLCSFVLFIDLQRFIFKMTNFTPALKQINSQILWNQY